MSVLAADLGNSKTHVVVTDGDGVVRGAAAGPGWVSGGLTADTALDHVLALADRAGGRPGAFEAAALAMAGLDLPAQEAAMAERARGVAARVSVVNDTFALLRAGSPSGEGVAVVAGAGINCVGVRGERVARFHSLGRLSGDWGGGYDVGADALALACRAEDGRGAPTALARLVPQHFGLERPLQVSEAVLAGTLRKDRLLELCPAVFAAASDDDAVARTLLDRLAAQVVALADTATARLDWSGGPVPLVLGGGLLQARHPAVLAGVARGLRHETAVTVCDDPPVVGSVLMALDLLGVPAPEGLAADVRRALGLTTG